MAVISITIPDAVAPRVVKALCDSGGFSVANGANAKQALVNYIKTTLANVETGKATQEAIAAVPAPVDPGLT